MPPISLFKQSMILEYWLTVLIYKHNPMQTLTMDNEKPSYDKSPQQSPTSRESPAASQFHQKPLDYVFNEDQCPTITIGIPSRGPCQ